jgi:hypothetical protein
MPKCERAEFPGSVRQVKFCKVRPVGGRKLIEAHHSDMLCRPAAAYWHRLSTTGLTQNGPSGLGGRRGTGQRIS